MDELESLQQGVVLTRVKEEHHTEIEEECGLHEKKYVPHVKSEGLQSCNESEKSNDDSGDQQSQYVVTREIIDIKEDQGEYFYSCLSENIPVNRNQTSTNQNQAISSTANLDAVINAVLGLNEPAPPDSENDSETEDYEDSEDKGSCYEPSDAESNDGVVQPKKKQKKPPTKEKVPPKCSTIGIDILSSIGDMKGYTCDTCNALFAVRNMFIRHCKNFHNDDRPFKCNKCKKKFSRTDHLKVHILAVHTDYYFSCEQCDKKYKHKTELKRHIKLEHLKTLSYDCDQCDEKFSNAGSLCRHKTTHNNDRPFICDHCGQGYKVKPDLTKHVKCVHHKIRRYKCKDCKRSFFSASHLTRHQRTHNGSKPFSCFLCSTTFIQKSNLDHHIKVVHNKVKDFICATCGHAFGHKHDLIRHELTHSGKNMFPCQLCGKHFSQKVTLKRHIRFVHENQRNYICVECDSRFTTKSHLDRHCNTHIDNRSHKCIICDKGFKTKEDLRRHLRQLHKASTGTTEEEGAPNGDVDGVCLPAEADGKAMLGE